MPVQPSSYRVTHYGGTLTSTPTKVEIRRGLGVGIRVFNAGSNTVDISFDSGYNWYPILSHVELSLDARFHYFFLKSDSGSTYNALVFEG